MVSRSCSPVRPFKSFRFLGSGIGGPFLGASFGASWNRAQTGKKSATATSKRMGGILSHGWDGVNRSDMTDTRGCYACNPPRRKGGSKEILNGYLTYQNHRLIMQGAFRSP